jgi:hypothetical protein
VTGCLLATVARVTNTGLACIVALSAVIGALAQVHASIIAIVITVRTVQLALSADAEPFLGTSIAALPTMLGIAAQIHAIDVEAAECPKTAVRNALTRGAEVSVFTVPETHTAVVPVAIEIHALLPAFGQAIVAGQNALSRNTAPACRAGLAAAAAVSRVGLSVDAEPTAVAQAAAIQPALARGADLSSFAGVVAVPAVIRVAERIDAPATAIGKRRKAALHALAGHADRTRTRANNPAGAAVVGVIVGVDTFSLAYAHPIRARRQTSTFDTGRFVALARIVALTTVNRARRQIDTIVVAQHLGRFARRLTDSLAALLIRETDGATTAAIVFVGLEVHALAVARLQIAAAGRTAPLDAWHPGIANIAAQAAVLAIG